MPSKNQQQRRQEKVNQSATVGEAAPWLDRETVALVLSMKALLMVYAVVAVAVLADQPAGSFYGWLERWNHWDGPHYLDIARDGYVTTDLHSKDQRLWIVFYPLYPWAIRLVAVVLRDYLVSAHVVSLLGAIAAGLAFRRLAELDMERRLARAALVFMLIFPTAYFLHVVYTESVFMALALGCFLAARKRRWMWAGILGALACMTRVTGLLLVPALAVEALTQYREGGREFRREWLWIPFAGAGFAVYLLVNYVVWGDPLMFQKVLKQYWYKELASPWVGIATTWGNIRGRGPSEGMLIGALETFFIAFGLACTVWSWKRLRPSYAVWMTLNWLLFTSTSFIMSTPRYTLSLFPVYLLFARLAEDRPFWGTIITISSVLLLALFAGQFAQGHWAY